MFDLKLSVLDLLFLYDGLVLANYISAYFGDKNFKKAYEDYLGKVLKVPFYKEQVK